MIPPWLTMLSVLSLALAAGCAIVILVDIARLPQKMWIMAVVWPVSALFGSVFVLGAYFLFGRANVTATPPFAVMTAKGSLHCGSGCTLGDICAEWLAFLVPAVAGWFGWQSVFADKIFAVWILDYILAFGFGVAFQYFTIAPMRGLGPAKGIKAAVKADTLSLTAWQIGMYGFMAVAHFWIFESLLGTKLEVDSFAFWFMMQIAMVCGFATSYPVNWWLIKAGIKEKM